MVIGLALIVSAAALTPTSCARTLTWTIGVFTLAALISPLLEILVFTQLGAYLNSITHAFAPLQPLVE